MSNIDKFSLVDFIIRYENGELDLAETVRGFQYLLDHDLIRELQGHYQRKANSLLSDGLINTDGLQITRMGKFVNKITRRYRGARVAKPYETMWVIAKDRKTGELNILNEEHSDCWAELEEVAHAFMFEDDGETYYVGDAAGFPVKPSYAELTEIASYVAQRLHEYTSFTSVELLAFKLHEVSI